MKSAKPLRFLVKLMKMAQSLPFILLFSALLPLAAQQTLPETVEFSRDIRPILSDRCFLCHGPDEANRKVNLRLDVEREAKHSSGDKTPIVPGNPAASEVMRRITAPKESRMPPSYSGARALSDHEVALIRRWIEQGARWQTHWAFMAPQRPDPPPVAHTDWPRNPI